MSYEKLVFVLCPLLELELTKSQSRTVNVGAVKKLIFMAHSNCFTDFVSFYDCSFSSSGNQFFQRFLCSFTIFSQGLPNSVQRVFPRWTGITSVSLCRWIFGLQVLEICEFFSIVAASL